MNVMKNSCFVFALLILLASAWSQEENAAPARKSNLLSRRPVGGRALGKGAHTTSTTAAPADEEFLENDDENGEEKIDEYDSDEPVVTTPAPTKQPFKLGVRPFRSNDDLLQSLKRRQQDSKDARKAAAALRPAGAEQSEDELENPALYYPSRAPVYRQRTTRKQYGRPKPSLKKVEQKSVEEAEQDIEDIAEVAASPSLPGALARRAVRSRVPYSGKRN